MSGCGCLLRRSDEQNGHASWSGMVMIESLPAMGMLYQAADSRNMAAAITTTPTTVNHLASTALVCIPSLSLAGIPNVQVSNINGSVFYVATAATAAYRYMLCECCVIAV